MKRAIIGGFLSLIGTIGNLLVFVTASNNMASEWSTPPGRFLTTVAETGMGPLMAASCLLLLLGLLAMGIEYFKKDEK